MTNESGALRLWRLLIWLLPLACLVALGIVAVLAAGQPSADPWTGVVIVLAAVAGEWLALFLALGVAAAIVARRGGDRAALVMLAGTCAGMLSGLGPLGGFSGFGLLLTAPGFVAGGLALLGLLLMRRGPVVLLAIVVGLLAIPPVMAGRAQLQRMQYFANDCPAGPPIDLTFTGAATGHYTVACDLPRSGRELTGCTSQTVLVGFFTGRTVWSLDIPPSPAGVTVVSDRPGPRPSLVADDQLYGSGFGWRGSYTFDTACSGRIDASLFGGPGLARPVHVSGRFATVRR